MTDTECTICTLPEVVEWIDEMAPRERRMDAVVRDWHNGNHPMSLDEFFVEWIADAANVETTLAPSKGFTADGEPFSAPKGDLTAKDFLTPEIAHATPPNVCGECEAELTDVLHVLLGSCPWLNPKYTGVVTAKANVAWIAMMGFESLVDVQVRNRRILVDAETLERMASHIVACGIAGDDEDRAYAADIRKAERVGHLYDVTDFGGDIMQDQLIEQGVTDVDRGAF